MVLRYVRYCYVCIKYGCIVNSFVHGQHCVLVIFTVLSECDLSTLRKAWAHVCYYYYCIFIHDEYVFFQFQLTNGAKVMSIFTNIESGYFLLFLVTTLLLIFKSKEGLVRLLQQFILCCYFFETVRLKIYVNILSNIFVVTVCIAYSLSLLLYHHFCRSCCCQRLFMVLLVVSCLVYASVGTEPCLW